jgi:S1-C subfamily serine protease
MSGVLITQVEPLSPAFDAELERGSVVLEINRVKVASVADYRRIADAARPGDALTLYVYTPGADARSLHTIQVEGQ